MQRAESSWTPSFPGEPAPGTMYYGVAMGPNETITSFETRVGKKIGTLRKYYQASDSVNSMVSGTQAIVSAGRLPLISTKIPGNDWAGVANGNYDAWLNSLASGMATVTGPVWFCIHHEPRGDGTQADYRAMYDRATPILKQAPNLMVGPILNGWSFKAVGEDEAAWVSGLVDMIGFDSYNEWWTYQTADQLNLDGAMEKYRVWDTVEQTFGPILDVTDTWGKRVYIGEYGCHLAWNEPGKSGAWMNHAYDYLLQRKVAAVSYFNSSLNAPRGSWELDRYTVIPPNNAVYQASSEKFDAFRANCYKPGIAYI